MVVRLLARVAALLLGSVFLLPTLASAQAASGIAGLVRDTTGAVLPGVTVEASSPALIEKVRSGVTDGEGRYNIVNLRPGQYVVTFTLTGFSGVRREGIDLPGGFTATVNADMRVGSVEETITVSGASPLVDTSNVRQQSVVQRELLDALPSGGRSVQALVSITPGLQMAATQQDVGGSRGESFVSTSVHGSRAFDSLLMWDGMRATSLEIGGGGRGILMNMGSTQEIVLQTGGISAESPQAGLIMNVVPKEGGNRFAGYLLGNWTNNDFQSDNLTDGLRARGLTLVNSVKEIWDANAGLGGPLVKDKLWFFTATRSWGRSNIVAGNYFNKTQGTPFYTPDLSRPAINNEHNYSQNLRLTWQATPRNKFNFFGDIQDDCSCRPVAGTAAPEAVVGFRFKPAYLAQATWTAPVTTRLLLEAGFTGHPLQWPGFAQPEVGPNDISILEVSTGFRYNSPNIAGITAVGGRTSAQVNERFSASYVTGSHSIKTGLTLLHGWRRAYQTINGNIDYTFRNGVPLSVNIWAAPIELKEREKAELGLYVQDQWTVNRLTLNLGLRYDYLNSFVPAQKLPANQYLPERSYAAVPNVPNFKDVNPRAGVAWDIFGTGKTALKGNVGRYVGGVGVDLARAANPVATVVSTASRNWTDANGDFTPQESELGPYSAATFGQPRVTSRLSSAITEGFGVRANNWNVSAEVQHELMPGLSVTGGYYRRWFGNFTASDNQAVVPENYSPYSITAPADPRLPGGGGYVISGLADVSVARFGQIDVLALPASNFGEQKETADFVNLSFAARLPRAVQVGGGFDTGRRVTDACFVVDSPQALYQCRVVTPMRANSQLKLYASYPLPWGFGASGTYQSLPGIPIQASYVATNAQIAPSLGRNLASCGLAAVCNGTSTVNLIEPNTMFEGRINQVDLRLAKTLRFQHGIRLNASLDLYNAFNASPVLSINAAYGPRWLTPQAILDGRLVKFGAQLTF
ncbi:MAG: TonB-dependent receptor [Vicinamibacterales bacterium]